MTPIKHHILQPAPHSGHILLTKKFTITIIGMLVPKMKEGFRWTRPMQVMTFKIVDDDDAAHDDNEQIEGLQSLS